VQSSTEFRPTTLFGKNMRPVAILLMLLFAAGCAENAPLLTQAKKDSLRALLDPKSSVAVPKDREGDFFEVIEAFAEGRRPDEFVRSIEFGSRSEATLLFADGGIHGGGSVTLGKKSGRWTITQKLYNL
jgi:hypothetical protein